MIDSWMSNMMILTCAALWPQMLPATGHVATSGTNQKAEFERCVQENATFVKDYSSPLTHENFQQVLDRYPIGKPQLHSIIAVAVML